MLKLDLNKEVIGLDGKKVEGSNLGKTIAEHLAYSTNGDALKMMSWATKLYNGEQLELDLSDLETFKEFIKNNNNLSVLFKSRVLEALI